jgi:hypothetical protein
MLQFVHVADCFALLAAAIPSLSARSIMYAVSAARSQVPTASSLPEICSCYVCCLIIDRDNVHQSCTGWLLSCYQTKLL